MNPPGVHVIGAGLAGLSAAVALTRAGVPVRIYEAAPQAGGRCRSYHDARLDCLIDNGNHLVLSGNAAVQRFLDAVEAPANTLHGPPRAVLPFVDLATGERWQMRPNAGPLPWWVLARRIPGTRLADYAPGLRMLTAGPETTVGALLRRVSPTARARFWEPMVWAVLNTVPDQGAAQPLGRVLRETFAKGERACRPLVARDGLGPAFIDPALAWLDRQRVSLRTRAAVKALEIEGGRVSGLHLRGERVPVAAGERVILALPPDAVARLLPDLAKGLPTGADSILNAHFRLPAPPPLDTLAGGPLLGLVNATTHWIFIRGDVVSLTVSAANALGVEGEDEAALLARLWAEVCRALALADQREMPPARLLVERRATFHQSPEQIARRPSQALGAAGPANLALAGDWTDTGLPATIEGALRSGEAAANAAAARTGVPAVESRQPCLPADH